MENFHIIHHIGVPDSPVVLLPMVIKVLSLVSSCYPIIFNTCNELFLEGERMLRITWDGFLWADLEVAHVMCIPIKLSRTQSHDRAQLQGTIGVVF